MRRAVYHRGTLELSGHLSAPSTTYIVLYYHEPTVLCSELRMTASDIDIAQSAYQWMQLHGDEAIPKARAMIEAMRQRGDNEGADFWLRVIEVITTLGEPPTEARH